MADTEKTDANKGQTLPWLILFGILGVFAVGTPLPQSGRRTHKAAIPADPAAGPRTRIVNPLLKPDRGVPLLAPTAGTRDLTRDVHGYKTEFLIATVPDPIDSPYGYAFDQVVDAIQRGVQQKDGYLLDRAWLPWEVDRKPKPAAPSLQPPQPDLRETECPGSSCSGTGRTRPAESTSPACASCSWSARRHWAAFTSRRSGRASS